MSLIEQMDKEYVVHLHYKILLCCLKKNEILKFAGKAIELEKNILSNLTQTNEFKHGIYSFITGYV